MPMTDGIIGSYFPGVPLQPGAAATFCAVCTCDGKSYAVYIGLVDAKHARNISHRAEAEQWVARRGSKVRYDQAILYFPSLKADQYRA